MTAQPGPTPTEVRPVGPILRPLRDLAALVAVAAPAVLLFVAVIRLIPSSLDEPYSNRVQDSFYGFVNVPTIGLPLLAVLLATVVRPAHPRARLITLAAVVEYAVAAFFGIVFGILIGLVRVATFSVRVAFEELLVRAAWLAVLAVAAYAVVQIWRGLFHVPRPTGYPQPHGGGPFGPPGPGQQPYGPPYGQQPYPGGPPGQPGPGGPGQPYPPPHPAPGHPHAPQPAWGQPPMSGPPMSGPPMSGPPASGPAGPGAPAGGFPGAGQPPPAPPAPPAPAAPGWAQPTPPSGQPGPYAANPYRPAAAGEHPGRPADPFGTPADRHPDQPGDRPSEDTGGEPTEVVSRREPVDGAHDDPPR